LTIWLYRWCVVMMEYVLQIPGEPAGTWYSLFNLYLGLGFLVGGVVVGMMIYFIMKYREANSNEDDEIKPGVIPKDRGNIKIITVFFGLTAIILFTLASYSILVTNYVEKVPKADDIFEVTVIGFQWGWKFIYPNGTEVVGEVVVPKDKIIVFRITSDDVFHKFQLIEFRTGADAIPGAFNVIWIQPTEPGTYTIQCYELCGLGHSVMVATMRVV